MFFFQKKNRIQLFGNENIFSSMCVMCRKDTCRTEIIKEFDPSFLLAGNGPSRRHI